MKRPLKNILSVAGGDVISRLLGFVITAYLARVLGASPFGLMSIGVSVLNYVVLLSSPGLHMMGSRDVASGSAISERYPSEIVSLRLMLTIAFVVLGAIVVSLFVETTASRVVIIAFTVTAIPLALSLDWYLQGKERLLPVSSSKVLMYVIYAALVFLLVATPEDIVWTAVAFCAANLISSLWLLMVCAREGRSLRFVWDPPRWMSLLADSFPMGISSLLSQTIMNLPVLLVGMILTTSDAGLFSSGLKLVFFVLMVDRVFYMIFFPLVARYRAAGEEHFAQVTTLGFKVVLAFVTPVAIIGMIYAPDVLTLVYGPSYSGATLSLQILLSYFVFSTLNTVSMCSMIAEKREREYLRVALTGTGLVVTLCLVLTLAFGIEGTSAGLSIGEGVMCILLIVRVTESVELNAAKIFIPPLTGGLAMAAMLVMAGSLSPLVLAPLGILTFFVLLFLFGGLTRDDLRFLRERFV